MSDIAQQVTDEATERATTQRCARSTDVDAVVRLSAYERAAARSLESSAPSTLAISDDAGRLH